MASHMHFGDRAGFSSFGLTQFELRPDMRPEAKCLRLLCGTCEVTNTQTGVTVEVATNFLEAHSIVNHGCDLSFLDRYQEGICAADYNSYFSTAQSRNRGFYGDFLDEMTVACCAAESRLGVISFLHLYRAYERISYAFPMIYAAKTKDYLGSFGKLKEWLADKKSDGSSAGELAFFGNFMNSFYGDDERNATTDFNFIGSDDVRGRQFSLIKNNILKWNPGDVTAGTIDGEKISVKFSDLHALLLGARNRYFHQMSGRSENIKQSNVLDSETFFLVLSGPLIAYIAKIFHDLVIFDMRGI